MDSGASKNAMVGDQAKKEKNHWGGLQPFVKYLRGRDTCPLAAKGWLLLWRGLQGKGASALRRTVGGLRPCGLLTKISLQGDDWEVEGCVIRGCMRPAGCPVTRRFQASVADIAGGSPMMPGISAEELDCLQAYTTIERHHFCFTKDGYLLELRL